MFRNLMNRVEACTPIEDRAHRERLWEILQIQLNDRRSAWDLNADGSYFQRRAAEGEEQRGTHQILMDLTKARCNVVVGGK